MARLILHVNTPKSKTLKLTKPNYHPHHLLSSKSDPTEEDSQSQSQSSFSAYFNDIRASLKSQQNTSMPYQPSPRRQVSYTPPPTQSESLAQIRKNLSEFRDRTTPPPSKHVSFLDLYRSNVIPNTAPTPSPMKSTPLSFDAIRESLRHLKPTQQPIRAKLGPTIIGSDTPLPVSVFGNEMKKKDEEGNTDFVKIYTASELGEKLRKLRPKVLSENWFSISELNERLVKLRKAELEESESNMQGAFRGLRESLLTIKLSDEERAKKSTNFCFTIPLAIANGLFCCILPFMDISIRNIPIISEPSRNFCHHIKF